MPLLKLRRPQLSFRASVIVLTICAVLLPLSIVSGVFYSASISSVQQNCGASLETIAQACAEDVNGVFERTMHSVELTSRAPILVLSCNRLATNSPDTRVYKQAFASLSRMLNIINHTTPWTNEIQISDLKTQQVIVSSDLQLGETEQNSTLRPSSPRLGGIALTPEQSAQLMAGGAIICQSSPTSALAAKDNSSALFFYCAKIIEHQEKPVAMLAMKVSANDLSESLLPNVYIVNSSCYRITAPRQEHFSSLTKWMQANYAQDETTESISSSADDSVNHPLAYRANTGMPLAPFAEFSAFLTKRPYKSQLIDGYTCLNGHSVVGAWAPTKYANLMVVSEIPRKDMNLPQAGTILMIQLAIAGVFTVFAAITAESLTKPLASLSQIANAIAAGDHSQRCNSSRPDEIGSFAYTFDVMAETLEFALTDLQEAKDNAEQANATKSKFLTHVNTRLSTPLNYILKQSGELEQSAREQQDANADDLHKIHTSAQNLSRLINGVLDITRIESGDLSIVCEDFSIKELVESVTISVAPTASNNLNVFQTEMADKLPNMHTDQTKLRQILINVIGNALKFTHKGTVTLKITMASNPKDAQLPLAVFAVSDTGIGMSPEQCQRVFEEFTQADDSTTRNYGGTGLGLTLVQRLVTLLDGKIKVQSQVGKGTTFIISLPIRCSGALTPQTNEASPQQTNQ